MIGAKKLFNVKICKSRMILAQDCSLNNPIAIITTTLAAIKQTLL